MWRRRVSPSLYIDRLGGGEHASADVPTERRRGLEVDVASDQVGEVLLEAAEGEVAHAGAGLELDQHVDIALGVEVVSQDRAEDR
jgi:hypothetical protein